MRRGHSLLHILITLTSMVLPASLIERLGALDEQQQMRGSCLAGKLVFFEGWEPKRHGKRAAGHSLLHTLIISTSVVLPASLNMQLGAPREQQQLHKDVFSCTETL